MYPRVHGCTLASKAPLSGHGFVHCTGAFQTPTHYGTSTISACRYILRLLLAFYQN